jgi:lysyl-tRNA synthetase class 2
VSDQELRVRRERLEKLRAAGVDPFPARVGPHARVREVRALHDAKGAEQLAAEQPAAAIVGRVRATRSFGKLVFATLGDDGATLQISARKGVAPDAAMTFAQALDVGDFVRVEGVVWRTQKGELTLDLRAGQMLAKALRPLPDKWHGLVDVEARYRQRYLDLLSNPRAREIALLRSKAISALRRTLDARGFLEVETPVLQPLYGGAGARSRRATRSSSSSSTCASRTSFTSSGW